MYRAIPSALAAALAIILFGTGCPIWLERDPPPEACVGIGCPCRSHDNCAVGYYCADGACVPAGECYIWACPSGFVCDSRGTCVPEPSVRCDEDADCPGGYCDDDGVCIGTGRCRPGFHADCRIWGESFVCDDRGVCVPDRGPCPDGTCGCTEDSDCTGGLVCRAGRCLDPATLCTVNSDCPLETTCEGSFCRATCTTDDHCPATQVCTARICTEDPDGGGDCLYASECPDPATRSCVNGHCVLRCESDDVCAAFETCQSRLCLPDMARNPR